MGPGAQADQEGQEDLPLLLQAGVETVSEIVRVKG